MIFQDKLTCITLLQKRFVITPQFFSGTDQNVTRCYKHNGATVASDPPLEKHPSIHPLIHLHLLIECALFLSYLELHKGL